MTAPSPDRAHDRPAVHQIPAATTSPTTDSHRVHPYRAAILVLESLVAVGGLVGTVQLLTGVATPEVGVLEPLGLTSWRLPALWLFGTVVVPSTCAAWLAWRRSPLAPTVVLLGAATLALELVVQIPFLGWNVLQAVFGAVAGGLAVLAVRARRHGWSASPDTTATKEGDQS